MRQKEEEKAAEIARLQEQMSQLAREKAEKERIAAEKERIAEEKERIAEEKMSQLAREKGQLAAEKERIAAEKEHLASEKEREVAELRWQLHTPKPVPRPKVIDLAPNVLVSSTLQAVLSYICPRICTYFIVNFIHSIKEVTHKNITLYPKVSMYISESR